MQIYNVYQSGKRLYIDEKENPDNKIVVNKYDNMQQTLRLISDGTLPPRLYWALRNPKLSNKYFILKLVNNEDLIVGTDISATPGLWDMLLIGTDDDYIIEGTDIDQSRLTYVSDHFGRLFVRDNFLEELDFEEQCSPTFRIFYDEIIFQLGEKADKKDIPDKLSDLENDTNFISGVALKDDGEGNVKIVGTTFEGGETEEGGGGNYNLPVANETTLGGVKPLNKTDDMTLEVGVDKDGRLFAKGKDITVDSELDEGSKNPVQNKVLTKEVDTLKEHNTQLKETIEKLQIKVTTEKESFHNIKDSANMKVVDFGMEGKTTQDGTPTPENQVEIVNAGVYNEETGRYEIGCKVVNKNLWDAEYARDVNNWIPSTKQSGYSEIPVYVGTNNKVSISYKDTLSAGLGIFAGVVIYENGGIYSWLYHSAETNLNAKEKTITPVGDYIWIMCLANNINNGSFMQYIGNDLQIEIADAPTGFVPHASQPFTLTSPEPLTKWDKLVKRDGVWGWSIWSIIHSITEDEYMTKYTNFPAKFGFNIGVGHPQSMKEDMYCNIAKPSSWGDTVGTFGMNDNYFYINFQEEEMTKEECLAKIKETPIELCYKTAEEQAFHPLPDEEQELLNNLETYYGVTNLYNDQGCPMWLTYVADPKLYVDKKLEQINNALLSLGANV